jgi:hypothetical protein
VRETGHGLGGLVIGIELKMSAAVQSSPDRRLQVKIHEEKALFFSKVRVSSLSGRMSRFIAALRPPPGGEQE